MLIVKNFVLKLLKSATKDQNIKFNHYLIILQEILDKLTIENNLFILNDAYSQYENFVIKEQKEKIIHKKRGNNLIFERDYFITFLNLIKEKYLNSESNNLLEKFNNFVSYD